MAHQQEDVHISRSLENVGGRRSTTSAGSDLFLPYNNDLGMNLDLTLIGRPVQFSAPKNNKDEKRNSREKLVISSKRSKNSDIELKEPLKLKSKKSKVSLIESSPSPTMLGQDGDALKSIMKLQKKTAKLEAEAIRIAAESQPKKKKELATGKMKTTSNVEVIQKLPKKSRKVLKQVEKLGLDKDQIKQLCEFMEFGKNGYANLSPHDLQPSKSSEARANAMKELEEMEKLMMESTSTGSHKSGRKARSKLQKRTVAANNNDDTKLLNSLEGENSDEDAEITVDYLIPPVPSNSNEDEESNANQSHQVVREKISVPQSKEAFHMDILDYLAKVQNYFDQLGYERNGEPNIRVNLRLSIKQLMVTVKQLLKAGQHIKCLHALIMAVYFTNHVNIVERFPIHFKSSLNGTEYKHVVLGIYVHGHFGALGISRDPGLQDKPAIYPKLAELINDYFKCYNDSGHDLMEVKLGSIITHDPHSIEHITWKLAKISFNMSPGQIENELEKCAKRLRSQMTPTCLKHQRQEQIYPGGIFPLHRLSLDVSRSKPLPKKSLQGSKTSQSHDGSYPQIRSRTLPPRKK